MKTLLFVLLAGVLAGCGDVSAAPSMTSSSFAPTPVTCTAITDSTNSIVCPPAQNPGRELGGANNQ